MVDKWDPQSIVRRYRGSWAPRSFLAGLDHQALVPFLAEGTLVHFGKGDVLVREGDAYDGVFLLLSSYVKVSASRYGGGQTLLAVRFAGDVIGEMAATDGNTRCATVEVCSKEPVAAVRLDETQFERAVDTVPGGRRLLFDSVVRKLRTSTRRRVDYAKAPVRLQLARLLVEMADEHGHVPRGRSVVIGANLTQVEWGMLIGVSPRTVQRALGELKLAGLIDPGRNRMLVRDVPGLRALIGEQL
ncbi:cAMP-binding domain of CRP or a regulatory subunit of cAMP-dependent protein kinases [Streptomyces sp. yr375]|uniref:Crp/Fnr family transcriptional regulator n=1 Tax=Streptomyces sp. yr375 TaxID=1761906 RepID=UPI0008B9FD0F|nr:Crp/Fnr family transcriptional regulator [Streptomyces sp. yr375]SES14077.1 cAMP-binding domain of CRP or a regulatory subunit of cAMP-dependent protein kinases [Streptomyces sp. yr375]